LPISPQQAAIELMRRRKLRNSYADFIASFNTEPKPARHHQLLIKKLQEVADGKCKRLMVFMPPGAAKSHYANVMFSAFMIGRKQGIKLLTASYSGEVADKWGRKVRSIVREDSFCRAFNVNLSQDSQAAGRWALDNGSEYYAVGVGGSVTSYRADIGIIDDPVKGREEADSETIRNKTIEWYKSDFWTRLRPDAAVVIIQTRWHEEDLSGWLLEEAKTGGEKWDVLKLPMLAQDSDPLGRAIGEPLWPEWFTPDMINIAKRDERMWSALYQQSPAPDSGNFFKREWIKYYDGTPSNMRIYGASDYAVTAGGGDYTVHGVFGVDSDDNIYVIDWWRGQTESLAWVEQLMLMIKSHKPVAWFEEGGQINKSMGPLIAKRQQETQAWCTRQQFNYGKQNKEMRAQSIRGRMQQGKILFPKASNWCTDLVSEMLLFPAGKHDDQVDVLSLLGLALADMHGAQKSQYKSIMMG
jgi:predicted phage terminase large subunit-like protein